MRKSFSMEIDDRSTSLLQYMSDEGLVPSPEEEIKRKYTIQKLKKILMEWAKSVAYQRGYQTGVAMASCATLRVFGSYGLGAHDSSCDIDALCVAPNFTTLEDFFGVLGDMLESTNGVSDILCIKNGKVPLMKFNFDGIQFDLPYAKLNAPTILDVVDVLNPLLLKNIDEVSWRSMSGVVTNKTILQLVPNIKAYQSLLRCVKFWAKRRGIYGFALGYFGGIHLAVLTAVICRKQPANAVLSSLVSVFFETYASWQWPTPVFLEQPPPEDVVICRRNLMPIHLPGSKEFIWSNVTKSTLDRIKREFVRGYCLTRFDWKCLFEPCIEEESSYQSFLKIRISSSCEDELRDWFGWVKSRLRYLLFKLDELPGVCNPNSDEYEDDDGPNEPNKIIYWGLDITLSKAINIKSLQGYFTRSIMMGRQEGPIGKMSLSLVKQITKHKVSEHLQSFEVIK